MTTWDLCLAWNWEFDRDFIRLLEAAFSRLGLSLHQVTKDNLNATLEDLTKQNVSFNAFLDRASDSDPDFLPLVDLMRDENILRVNPRELASWSADKTTMYREFVSHGLDTPLSILIPPFAEQPHIIALDLSPLGGRFAIKPASLGGGEGVVLNGSTMEEVLLARQQFPAEKYLLQSQVIPLNLADRPAWFRVLFCDGAVFPCWWHPLAHTYLRVNAGERFRFGLRSLYEITRRIASICRLDLFSTEIAMSEGGRSLVVDYVNDPVDLRLQSAAADGVPDEVVEGISNRLARLVERNKRAG